MAKIDSQKIAMQNDIDQEDVAAVLDDLVNSGWLLEQYIER